MGVVYLTIDGVMRLHVIALENGGGMDGVRSQQQLASAVGQPEQSAFGEDAYGTIPEKAAAYGFFIAEGQPLIDGNSAHCTPGVGNVPASVSRHALDGGAHRLVVEIGEQISEFCPRNTSHSQSRQLLRFGGFGISFWHGVR